jgi:hypothetical protein
MGVATHTVQGETSENRGSTVSIEFDQGEYDRLLEVTDSPPELVYDSAIRRLELEAQSVTLRLTRGPRRTPLWNVYGSLE